MTNKWVLHRAGLINFWYYDEQYFDFADGKLLLRGTNGSGKSVTMQSLLPVLLDGKKNAGPARPVRFTRTKNGRLFARRKGNRRPR